MRAAWHFKCVNGLLLAAAPARPRTLIDAAQFANRAAALSVTHQGAQPSLPTRAASTPG